MDTLLTQIEKISFNFLQTLVRSTVCGDSWQTSTFSQEIFGILKSPNVAIETLYT